MCQSSVLVPSDHHVAPTDLRLALWQVEKLEESTSFDDRSWINGQYPDMVKRMQYGRESLPVAHLIPHLPPSRRSSSLSCSIHY